MGLLSSVHENRSSWSGPYSLKDPELNRLFGYGSKTDAGIVVTDEMALMCAAVFQAVNVLSSDVAKAPLNLLKRRPNGGSDHYFESKTYHLLKTEPNPEMGAMTFRQTLMAHALTLGGGYAEIERNPMGQPVALWPITPNRICAKRDDRGNLFYLVDQKDRYAPSDILHIHGLGYDGNTGYSLLNLARQAIGLALATEKFASSFFGNNATIGGVISLEGSRDPEELKDYRAAIDAVHKGPDKSFRLLLLDNGAKFQPYTGTNQDAQMDELRDKQVEEVSRFYRIPVHKLNNLKRATYSNIEHQDLEYYKGPILDWFTLWEQECGRKLIARPERRIQFFKHNANVFLRGDISSRYSALGIARDKGIISANEWRELEDMNPQDGPQGDEYFMQSAQTPARLMVKQAEAQIKKTEQEAKPPEPPPAATPPAAPDDERAKRAEAMLAEVRAQLDAEIEKRAAAEATRDTLNAEVERRQTAETEARSALEAVKVELATMGAVSEADRARLVDAQAAVDAAQRDVESAKSERAVAMAEVAELRAREEAASTKWHDLSIVEADLRRERDALSALNAETGEKLTAEQQAREAAEASVRELTEQVEAAEARSAQALSEFNVAKDEAESAKAEATRLEALARDAVSGRAEAEAVANEARTAAQAAQERLSALDREVGETRTALAAVQAEAVDARRLVEESRSMVATDIDAALVEARSEQQALQAQLLAAAEEAGAVRAQLVQAQALADAAQRDADEARAVIKAERDRIREQQTRQIAARREDVVATMRRSLDRETDRARRAQQTPAKLKQWIESWYDGHAEMMYASLVTKVRDHVAFIGSDDDPSELTREMVNEHVASSRRQLAGLMDLDGDELAAALAGLLRRWESERVNEIPDRLMEREVAHVRN